MEYMANNQTFKEFSAPNYSVDVRNSSLQQQIAELTSLIHQLAAGNSQQTKICGICAEVGHPTDMCPLLQEESYDQMNASCDFPRPPQWQYDPYSNMNNSRWRDHHTFSYENPQVQQPTTSIFSSYPQYNQPYPHCQQQGQISNSCMSLEDILECMKINNLQFQQDNMTFKEEMQANMEQLQANREELRASSEELNADIKNLTDQIGQMTTAIDRLATKNFEELPSPAVLDQEDDESEVVLSIGTAIETPTLIAPALQIQEDADHINTEKDIVNIDVLCNDDVQEVVEQIDKEKLEDTIIHNLGLEQQEENYKKRIFLKRRY